MIGITVMVSGVMMIFAGRDGQSTWWGLVMGILYVVFGLFMVMHPIATLATLVWIFSIWAIIGGAFAIGMAFKLRSLKPSS